MFSTHYIIVLNITSSESVHTDYCRKRVEVGIRTIVTPNREHMAGQYSIPKRLENASH